MIQFDEHIFQMGWFNHQVVYTFSSRKATWTPRATSASTCSAKVALGQTWNLWRSPGRGRDNGWRSPVVGRCDMFFFGGHKTMEWTPTWVDSFFEDNRGPKLQNVFLFEDMGLVAQRYKKTMKGSLTEMSYLIVKFGMFAVTINLSDSSRFTEDYVYT